jgi:hypothetical protein
VVSNLESDRENACINKLLLKIIWDSVNTGRQKQQEGIVMIKRLF